MGVDWDWVGVKTHSKRGFSMHKHRHFDSDIDKHVSAHQYVFVIFF